MCPIVLLWRMIPSGALLVVYDIIVIDAILKSVLLCFGLVCMGSYPRKVCG